MKNIVLKIIFVLVVLAALFFYGKNPFNNWDMIGYMGVVMNMDYDDEKQAHEETYRQLKNEIDKKDLDQLVNRPGYRTTMVNDFKAFNENLKHYSVRVLYIQMVRLFYKSGVPLPFATLLPSLIAAGLSVCLLFFVLMRELNEVLLASGFALLLLLSPQMVDMARHSNPDTLSFLMLLIIVLLYFYKAKFIGLFLMMCLAVLTRTDNVIWCAVLLTIDIVSRFSRQKLWQNALAIVILFLIMFLVNKTMDYGGWWTMFYNSLIHRLDYPLTSTPPFDLLAYIGVLKSKSVQFAPWFLFILLYLLFRRKAILSLKISRAEVIILTAFFTFIAKFFLFPFLFARFHLILLISALVVFIISHKKQLNLSLDI